MSHYSGDVSESQSCLVTDLVDVIVDNIHRSQAVMFIVTEAMLQHEWCDFVFQYVAAQGFTNLVFIRYEPIRGEAWQSNQGPMRNVMNTSKHVISWPADQRKRDTFWKDVRLSLPPKLRPLKQNRQQEWEGKHELDYVWDLWYELLEVYKSMQQVSVDQGWDTIGPTSR